MLSKAKIQAYDPKAMDSAKDYFQNKIVYAKTSYKALDGADALLLLTEWNEFRRPDFEKIKQSMNSPVVFDGRNQYNGERLIEKGFDYHCIGKTF